ncbi:hypothetical protein O7599_22955 [Streptomyces sp. WMMC500]|uniref:hypothetical protein n=1 Tax=Streptomyces sp. WMMC500 TaxID=3015154 RepID=UPI00248C0C14|nr:hypothetical protein [Streptomyces sp. WMMC500]WBB58485.1 hypothetical protein O7599_22955 [Streptomyces sp. WMMC500]
MNDESWYEIVQGGELSQGDILRDCSILRPVVPEDLAQLSTDPSDEAEEEIELESQVTDVVILSQTCDLENNKIDQVLVAKVLAYNELVIQERARGNGLVRSSKFRKACADGNMPAQFLLHAKDGDPEMPWSLVEFHHLFLISKPYLQAHARNGATRLRLASPYKEHLGQSFARYFMRVALPKDGREFEKYELD